MFVMVSYDVADDRRRLHVASELENFGERVQLSVFECHLESNQLRELARRLSRLIDPAEDRVRYYPLCSKDEAQVAVDGPGDVTRDFDYVIV